MYNVTVNNDSDRSNSTTKSPVSDFWDIGLTIVIPIICMTGILLNVLTLIVLRYLHGGFYIFIQALAVADIFALIFIAPFGFTLCRNCLHTGSDEKILLEIYVLRPVSNICITASIWITVALTVQRVILLASMSHIGQNRWKNASIKKLIFVIICAAFVFNIPRYFMEFYKNGNRKFSTSAMSMVYRWLIVLFVRLFPLVTLAISNLVLIIWLRRYRALQKSRFNKTSQHNVADARQTTTLFGIIFMFIIGNIPISIIDTSGLIATQHDFNKGYYDFMIAGNILETLSFALNFVFYCALNRQFMEACVHFFRVNICRYEEIRNGIGELRTLQGGGISTKTELIELGNIKKLNDDV